MKREADFLARLFEAGARTLRKGRRPDESLPLALVADIAAAWARSDASAPPLGLVTRSAARAEPVSLWAEFSFAALPFGAAAALVCLWLHIHDLRTPMDERGLAQLLIETQIEP